MRYIHRQEGREREVGECGEHLIIEQSRRRGKGPEIEERYT